MFHLDHDHILPVVKELQDSREHTFVTNEVQNLSEIYPDETKQFYEGEFTSIEGF